MGNRTVPLARRSQPRPNRPAPPSATYDPEGPAYRTRRVPRGVRRAVATGIQAVNCDFIGYVRRVIRKAALLFAVLAATAAFAAPAQARCASSSFDACFKFTVTGEIRSEGSWTNTDCSGGATGSGTWSQITRYRTLRSGVLKVHRWHPRRLFTLEQPHSGSAPFAPARLTTERTSSSGHSGSCGDPDPPEDCGARSAEYRQQLMPVAATRGIRLDFFDVDYEFEKVRYESCYAQPPLVTTLSTLKTFPLKRFFGRRKLVLRGGGQAPRHATDGGETHDVSTTVSWTLTLIRIP